VKRRDFITLLGGAAVSWPLAARAQQAAKVARIGYLGLASASWHTPRVNAFRAGLRTLGYAEGKDIVIEFRWAEGRYDQLPALAAELVRLNVDVIVTHTVPGAIAAKQATSTIPIVITAASDLLAFGLVDNLARPGGNLTGLSFFNAELVAKRLELLKELVPSLAKAAVLLNADNLSGNQLILRALEPTAKALKVELLTFEARGPGNFDGVFAAMAQRRSDAECKLQGDRGYYCQAPPANLRLPGIRGSRRLDGLWDKLTRDGLARRRLRRQDSQGCEASGPSSRARDEVHDDRQSQDGPDHGH
jgi:putative ABC transport system substrate-binding protein